MNKVTPICRLGFVVCALTTGVAAAKADLVLNGTFEAGDVLFDSDYLSTVHDGGNIFNQGVYHVGTNPNAVHGAFAAMGDHTSGSGNMMIVNGSSSTTDRVWFQTVAVNPNTDYYFSTFIASVHPASPAALVFSVNGNQIGSIFNASSTVGVWQQFYEVWNSGSNTSASLAIVNQNPTFSGNDFALDDIGFDTQLVPEPATMSALALGAFGLVRRRARK